MNIHVKVTDEKIKREFLDVMEERGMNITSKTSRSNMYFVDIDNNEVVDVEEGAIYYYQLFKPEDITRLIDILEDRVLARFNTGKIKFSYIDFRMFIDAFDLVPDTFNKIEKYEGRPEMLYEKMLKIGSALCFGNTAGEIVLRHTNRLLVLAYKAALIIAGVKKDTPHINMRAFEEMAKVLEFGAEKYDRNNWMKNAADKCELIDSLERHVAALLDGEELDPDSGLHHIGHIMCNVMFIHHHFNRYEG